MSKEIILSIVVKYNCKIREKGLVGYYIEMKSLISDAKWAGYVDSECLSWVADKSENMGIHFEKDKVEDIELEKVGEEYKIPQDQEDTNVFNIDIAFIKNVLSELKKPVVEQTVSEEDDNLIENNISMEDVVKSKKSERGKQKEDPADWFKLTESGRELPEYKEEDTIELLEYMKDKIAEHNFEFGNLEITEIKDIIRIGDYVVFCNVEKEEMRGIEVSYNKRHRLYVLTAMIKKDGNDNLDDALTLACFIKDNKALFGCYLPYYGTKFKDVANLSYLSDKKYSVLHKGNKDKIEFDKLTCYEFQHIVWLGDKGPHFGYMRYYFNTKDFSFVMRLNTFGGFYKYGFTID